MVDSATGTQVLESGAQLAEALFQKPVEVSSVIEQLYNSSPDLKTNALSVAQRFDQHAQEHTAVIIDATWKDVVDPETLHINQELADQLVQNDPQKAEVIKAIRVALSAKDGQLPDNRTLQETSHDHAAALDEFMHAIARGIYFTSLITQSLIAEKEILGGPDTSATPIKPLSIAAAAKFSLENRCTAIANVNGLQPESVMLAAEPLLLPAIAEGARPLNQALNPAQFLEILNAIPLLPAVSAST